MLVRKVPLRFPEADQRIASGPAGDPRGHRLGHFAEDEFVQPVQQGCQILDVGVEARRADAQVTGQGGDGDGLEAVTVGQLGGRLNHCGVVEGCTFHPPNLHAIGVRLQPVGNGGI